MMPCNDTRGISPQMATIFGLSTIYVRFPIGVCRLEEEECVCECDS